MMGDAPQRRFTPGEVANFLRNMGDALHLGDFGVVIEYWWHLSGYLWTRGLWHDYRRCEQLLMGALNW
jgi:hypothetical protein